MEVRTAECPLGAKCEEVKVVEGRQVMFRCPWYVKVRGIDMNTGDEVDSWNCAIAWLPTLNINTANEARKGAAAIESFRNEMAKQNQAHLLALRGYDGLAAMGAALSNPRLRE